VQLLVLIRILLFESINAADAVDG